MLIAKRTFSLQAVKQFYQDANLQGQVHQWLTAAQVSTEAWSFSWDLLIPEKVGKF